MNSGNEVSNNLFQSSLHCDSANENVCYTILKAGTWDFQIIRIDFSSISEFLVSDLSGSDYFLSEITAVNENEVIVAGYLDTDKNHTFYRYNFSNESFEWAVQAANLGKLFY